MGHIVRRTTQNSAIQENNEQLPPRTHQGNGIVVASQLTLGVEPRLALAWSVDIRHWVDGFTLFVFHSTKEFSPQQYPDELLLHGQLIIETRENGEFTQVPEEGTHFFTFILHKKTLFGLREKMSALRFSEIVPSAKVAIGRIKDRLELQQLVQRNEVEPIEHEARVDEAKLRRLRARRALEEYENPPAPKPRVGGKALIAEDLEYIDAMVEAVLARDQKISQLKRDKVFRTLKRKERESILDWINEHLDAGEISARREAKGS